ncbi:MAG: hypothetical protein ACT60Q_01000 [Ferrovibrionaceae bacterium]
MIGPRYVLAAAGSVEPGNERWPCWCGLFDARGHAVCVLDPGRAFTFRTVAGCDVVRRLFPALRDYRAVLLDRGRFNPVMPDHPSARWICPPSAYARLLSDCLPSRRGNGDAAPRLRRD